jgi:formylglycine-generating enzyme required for sulfatase activity
MSESFEEYAINGLDQSMAYDDVYRSKPDIDFKAIAFKEDYPAFIVDYLDALEFCNRLSLIHGLAPLYSISDGLIKVDYTKEGYRLPTSSEWFFAAIGGNYSKGYTFFGSDILNEVGVVFGDDPVNGPFYEGMISKIESKLPNELGLFDMNGNVEEWVWDYGGYLIEGMYITELATNQGSDNSKRQRLFKLGGSWMDTGFVLENIIEQQSFPRFLLADSRVAFLNDGKRYLEAGFRIVKNIPFDVEEINSRNGSL